MSKLKSTTAKALTLLTITLASIYGCTGSTRVYALDNSIQTMSLSTVASTQTAQYNITLNNKPVEIKTPILVNDGTTLLPIRAISELLGIKVDFDNELKIAFVEGNDVKLEIPVTNTANNKQQATLYNSTTYLPIRYVAEGLHLKIDYIANTRTIAIYTTSQTTSPSTITPTATPTVTPTPTATAGTILKHTPQEAFDSNLPASAIDNSYLQNFSSIGEVQKVLPYLNESGAKYTYSNSKYVTVKMNINSPEVSFGGSTQYFRTDHLSLPFSDKMIRFKDGTYTTESTLPSGKTLKDVSYFTYTQDDVLVIVKLENVNLDSFRL